MLVSRGVEYHLWAVVLKGLSHPHGVGHAPDYQVEINETKSLPQLEVDIVEWGLSLVKEHHQLGAKFADLPHYL